MLQLDHLVVAPSIEFQHVLMESEQTTSVRNCEQCYLQRFCLQVQLRLHVHTHR